MTLESLPNEFFLDLFEYFNAVDLLPSFFPLNRRFYSLLFEFCRTLRLDFRSILQKDLDNFYNPYLLLIKTRTIYLRLSDDEETPCQCSRLVSMYVRLDQFTNLRSLTLHKLGSDTKISQHFFISLHCLRDLTHLKFLDCSLFHVQSSDFQGVIDQIWTLPQLTHLYWDCRFRGESWFSLPTCVSSSLQCLTILQQLWSSNHFAPLFAKTPRLRRFHVKLDTYEEDDLPVSEEFIPSSPHLSVKKAFLIGVRSERLLTNLAHFLPNVTHLKIETSHLIKSDGHHWKQLLVKSFPQLKVFQLKMRFTFRRNENPQEQFNDYFSTYRTSFWIDRQWYFRARWGFYREHLSIYLYSLPYAFHSYFIPVNISHLQTESTCPADLSFWYHSVRQIGYEPWMFNDRVMSRVQLMNVESLSVGLPLDSRSRFVIPTFSNLRSLTIDNLPADSELDLQEILDCSPDLKSISFSSWTTTTMPPYSLKSSSIYRLNVNPSGEFDRRYSYSPAQCLELGRSPLGRQCRVLDIQAEELFCILVLTSIMGKLRTVHVQFENGPYYELHQKEIIHALQECLSSRWTITEYSYGNITIQS